jgi:hypothetical protein
MSMSPCSSAKPFSASWIEGAISVGALHGAVLLARVFHARDRAGHAHGEVAVGAQALDDVAVLVEVHVGRGGQRRLLAEVEEGLAAVGQLHGHEAAAAEVARGGVHHRQRIAHGHGRIDGVAAALEHVDADLAGQVLRAHDHAVLGRDRRLRRGVGRAGGRQREHRRHGGAQLGGPLDVLHVESPLWV